MNSSFVSEDLKLACHLARPQAARTANNGPVPGVVMCHGFPIGPLDARQSGGTFPELMDRVASSLGWAALTFTFRGCGESEGDFSLRGWLADLRSAVDHLTTSVEVSGVWLVGTSTGGSLAICEAAEDPRIFGVATLAARADFDDWAGQPKRFLDHAREIGAIRHANFPPVFESWARELRVLRPLEAASKFAPRSLLIIHGEEDESVPIVDSRLLAEAHGEAELRIISGAGHRLRHDPRAVAVLLGWLDRERSRLALETQEAAELNDLEEAEQRERQP